MDYVHLNKTKEVSDSIMFSTTHHRGRTCLTADDLEGLNFLYPVCESASFLSEAQPEPLCIKTKRLSGWLRLILSISVPFLACALAIIGLQLGVRRRQQRNLTSLEAIAHRLRQERSVARKELRERMLRSSKNLLTPRAKSRSSASPPSLLSRSLTSIQFGLKRLSSSHPPSENSSRNVSFDLRGAPHRATRQNAAAAAKPPTNPRPGALQPSAASFLGLSRSGASSEGCSVSPHGIDLVPAMDLPPPRVPSEPLAEISSATDLEGRSPGSPGHRASPLSGPLPASCISTCPRVSEARETYEDSSRRSSRWAASEPSAHPADSPSRGYSDDTIAVLCGAAEDEPPAPRPVTQRVHYM